VLPQVGLSRFISHHPLSDAAINDVTMSEEAPYAHVSAKHTRVIGKEWSAKAGESYVGHHAGP
jgi:hypothetical protein